MSSRRRTDVLYLLIVGAFIGLPSGEARASVLYAKPNGVSTGTCWTWGDACTLQQAIAVAVSGDQIWATKGVYRPALCVSNNCVCNSNCTKDSTSVRISSFSLKTGVKIYGGFDGTENALDLRDADPDPYTVNPATDSVLSGDLNGNDVGTDPEDSSRLENSWHVVVASGTDRTAILDGFTITAGYIENTGYFDGGGGVFIAGNSRATLRNLAIVSNYAAGGGGGIYCPGDSLPPPNGGSYIVGCVIANNVASHGGGIGGKVASNHRIFNCQIVGNVSYNQGGGLYLAEGEGSPIIANTLIAGNTADGGGGLWTEGGSMAVALRNCTFAENASAAEGGAIAITNFATVYLHNSAVWGNSASGNGDEIAALTPNPGSIQVGYSDVRQGAQFVWDPGHAIDFSSIGGNLNIDPQFVDPGNNNFRLSSSSPCIDAADNGRVAADDVDLDFDGNTTELTPLDLDHKLRFVDAPASNTGLTATGYPKIVDMGAYENQGCTTDADCNNDSDLCNGTEACVSGSCVWQFSDCNRNGINDICEDDCDANGVPDDDVCQPDTQLNALVGRAPVGNVPGTSNPQDGSLWRSAHNIVRLSFACDISVPQEGQVLIQELLSNGLFGGNLAVNNAFSFAVENGKILRIWDNGSTLIHRTWYAIRNASTWPGVANFEIHYLVQVGDATRDGHVLQSDIGEINTGISCITNCGDANHKDITGDLRVLQSDIAEANTRISSLWSSVPKPSGH